ncbi:hypothetical protein ACWKWP_15275 [Agromyces soli]
MNANEQDSWADEVNDAPAERFEGQYTEVDGEQVPPRHRHGSYVTDADADESDAEGSYTDVNGEGPQRHASERHGKYVREDQ